MVNPNDTAEPRTITVVTDRYGLVLSACDGAVSCVNTSRRFLSGRDLFLFLPEQRQQLAADLRKLYDGNAVQRSVTIRPKERAPQSATVTVEAMSEGVRWTIQLRGRAPRIRTTPLRTSRRPSGKPADAAGRSGPMGDGAPHAS